MTRVCAIPYEFEFLCSLALLKVHAPRWSAYVFRMNKALSVCERCSMRDALLHSVPPHRAPRTPRPLHAVFQLRYGDDVVVDYGLNYTCAGALALPIGR